MKFSPDSGLRGQLASRRNKKARDFTDPFIHKYTLLSIDLGEDNFGTL